MHKAEKSSNACYGIMIKSVGTCKGKWGESSGMFNHQPQLLFLSVLYLLALFTPCFLDSYVHLNHLFS